VNPFDRSSAPIASALVVAAGFFLALSDAGRTVEGIGVLLVIGGFVAFAITASARAAEARQESEDAGFVRGYDDALASAEDVLLEIRDGEQLARLRGALAEEVITLATLVEQFDARREHAADGAELIDELLAEAIHAGEPVRDD
jgi:hypothetical protein